MVRVVDAQLLQQRDVDGMRVRMEELGAEIDGDALPLVVDHLRIALTADLGSRLEEVDVEGAGEEVGRGHAARTGADDGDPLTLRYRSAVSGGVGRQVGRQRRPGTERRQADRALEGITARE